MFSTKCGKVIRKLSIILLMLGFFHSSVLLAQENFYKFHALFIYNFTRHVQWPDVGTTFKVGVFGSDNATMVLKENLANRKYRDKSIEVVNVRNSKDAAACQILYAPKSNRSDIVQLLDAIAGRSILTVTEDDMIDMGACISFVLKGTRLNFRISKKKVEERGLLASAALLSLGEIVD